MKGLIIIIIPKMKNAAGQFRLLCSAIGELVSQRTMLNIIIPMPKSILWHLQHLSFFIKIIKCFEI
jgi:hypothetical protein